MIEEIKSCQSEIKVSKWDKQLRSYGHLPCCIVSGHSWVYVQRCRRLLVAAQMPARIFFYNPDDLVEWPASPWLSLPVLRNPFHSNMFGQAILKLSLSWLTIYYAVNVPSLNSVVNSFACILDPTITLYSRFVKLSHKNLKCIVFRCSWNSHVYLYNEFHYRTTQSSTNHRSSRDSSAHA